MPDQVITFRLDDEDMALLDACCAKEKLTKSDILRRGLRAYAASLGVESGPERKPRRRKRK